MPSFTTNPPRGDHPVHGHFWIPIDDETCWAWSFDYHPTRALTATELAAMRDGKGIHVRYVPGTFVPLANRDNDYLIDRAAQKAGVTYSGVAGIAMQDASLQESMGPIVDRSRENLVSTDNGIFYTRQRLLRAAQALAEQGTAPPGIDPTTHRVRSAAVVLPAGAAFAEAAREALTVRPGVPPASVYTTRRARAKHTTSWRAQARHPRLCFAARRKIVGGGPAPAITDLQRSALDWSGYCAPGPYARRQRSRWGRKCPTGGVARSFTFAASSKRRSRTAASACGSSRNAATSAADIGPPCSDRLSTLSGDRRPK